MIVSDDTVQHPAVNGVISRQPLFTRHISSHWSPPARSPRWHFPPGAGNEPLPAIAIHAA